MVLQEYQRSPHCPSSVVLSRPQAETLPRLLMGKKGRAVRDASSFTRVPVQTFCQLGTLPLMATVITTVVKFLPSNTVRWGIKVST